MSMDHKELEKEEAYNALMDALQAKNQRITELEKDISALRIKAVIADLPMSEVEYQLKVRVSELEQELDGMRLRLADVVEWNNRLLAAPQQMVLRINKLEALCKLQHDQLDIANSIIDNEYPADHIDEFYDGKSRRAVLKAYLAEKQAGGHPERRL